MNDLFDSEFYNFNYNSTPFTRVEVPYGEYEAKLLDVNLKPSKQGKPMLSVKFEIVGVYNEANKHVLNQYHWINLVVLNSKDLSDKKNRFCFERAVDTLKDFGYTGDIKNLKDISDAVDSIKQSLEIHQPVYGIEVCDERGYKVTEIGAQLED